MPAANSLSGKAEADVGSSTHSTMADSDGATTADTLMTALQAGNGGGEAAAPIVVASSDGGDLAPIAPQTAARAGRTAGPQFGMLSPPSIARPIPNQPPQTPPAILPPDAAAWPSAEPSAEQSAEPSAEPSEVATEVASEGPSEVGPFLERVGLSSYAATFEANGFDDLAFLRRMEPAALLELLRSEYLGMKYGHAMKFGDYLHCRVGC